MSEQVERKLLAMLNHPTESPYGNPIPGLDELGDDAAGAFGNGVSKIGTRLKEADGPVTAIVRRLAEPAQFEPELLLQLKQAGIMPGNTGVFTLNGSYVLATVEGFGEGLELPIEVANHIYVADE